MEASGAWSSRVPAAGERGEDEQEDHQRAVLGEYLVVRVRGEELRARSGQLRPHQQRQDAAHHEESERVDQVQDPDLLVIGRGEPSEEARSEWLRAGERWSLDHGQLTSL